MEDLIGQTGEDTLAITGEASAVHHESVASDVAALIARKKMVHANEVLNFCDASQRREVFGERVQKMSWRQHGRPHRTRSYGIAANTTTAQLHSGRLRHADHGGLGRAVVE